MAYKVLWDKTMFKRVGDKMERAVEIAVDDAAGRLIRGYRSTVSKKSGELAESIEILDRSPGRATVGTKGVIYAAVQEFGGNVRPKHKKHLVFRAGGQIVKKRNVKVPGQFALKKAANRLKRELPKITERAIKDVGL